MVDVVGKQSLVNILHPIVDGRILAFHSRLNYTGVPKDEHARGTDEPKERAKWGGPPKKGQTDNKKSRIKRLLCYDVITHLHWLRGCVM